MMQKFFEWLTVAQPKQNRWKQQQQTFVAKVYWKQQRKENTQLSIPPLMLDNKIKLFNGLKVLFVFNFHYRNVFNSSFRLHVNYLLCLESRIFWWWRAKKWRNCWLIYVQLNNFTFFFPPIAYWHIYSKMIRLATIWMDESLCAWNFDWTKNNKSLDFVALNAFR